jgi:hypothetical protein
MRELTSTDDYLALRRDFKSIDSRTGLVNLELAQSIPYYPPFHHSYHNIPTDEYLSRRMMS